MSLDRYIALGRSDLRVSPFCLGTMTFGEDWGWGTGLTESEAVLAEYLGRGGNFIDTASIYANGRSEKIIGDFFALRKGRRDRTVIATKFFCNLRPDDPNGGGPKAMVEQCEQSLRRLQTDYIDLYWLHNWDRMTPIDETLRAMDDLVTAGKVRYLGVSDLPAWKAAQAQTIAQLRGWAPLVALRLEYSLLERTVEGELTPMAQEMGLGVMPWGPLKSGWLSGKYSQDSAGAVSSGRASMVGVPSEKHDLVIEAVREVAWESGASPAAVALAWVQSRAGVASTIIGARRPGQLHDNLTALDVRLTAAQIGLLDQASRPNLNFPAGLNRDRAPGPALAGAPVDGQRTAAMSLLAGSGARY